MKVNWPAKGTYIVAVSGGVDSVVLLDTLAKSRKQRATNHHLPSTNYQLVVAHIDHGWREDSAEDERFVRALSAKYQLPYESTRLNMSKKSEAAARTQRWQFLETIKDKYNAQAIITAHHRDDVLETMAINVQRGTGRSGLTSLKETPARLRPLLHCAKAELIDYATARRLEFVQDSTNLDMRYLRNRIRQQLASASPVLKNSLYAIYLKLHDVNTQIDNILGDLLAQNCDMGKNEIRIPRQWFKEIPQSVQPELLRTAVLSLVSDAELNQEQIKRGVAGITNALTGKITELGGRIELHHKRELTVLKQIGTQRMELLKYRDQEGD